jgi:hypothetical protein
VEFSSRLIIYRNILSTHSYIYMTSKFFVLSFPSDAFFLYPFVYRCGVGFLCFVVDVLWPDCIRKFERERERAHIFVVCILSLFACSLHVYHLLSVVIVLYTFTHRYIYIYIFGIACIILSLFYLVKDNELMHEKKTTFYIFYGRILFSCFMPYLLSI